MNFKVEEKYRLFENDPKVYVVINVTYHEKKVMSDIIHFNPVDSKGPRLAYNRGYLNNTNFRCLERVYDKIKATRLARKVYPNAEEKDGWLLV